MGDVSRHHPKRREWAERRKRLFGFEPDPDYYLAPFHPESINACLGRVCWSPDGSLAAGVIAVDVVAPGRPVLAQGERAAAIRQYLADITVAAGMPSIQVDSDGMIGPGGSRPA